MLADQKTKAIAEARVPILMTMVIGSGWASLRIRRTKRLRFPPKLFDRAEADAVSLPESTVDGRRLGHAHLGAPNQRRNVRWARVAIAHIGVGAHGFVDRRLKDPLTQFGFAKFMY
jgi:hypothetical protein